MEDAATRRGVIVMGMHRSGTSALTRVLNLLGASLPGNLMPPSPSNEAGFWESTDVQRLNDEILGAAGSQWDDWRHVALDALSPDEMERFHQRAKDLLARDFSESSCFVLKDPRLCRLLPFWRTVIEDGQDSAVSVVLPIRNPAEVAGSLLNRDKLPIDRGLLLWLRHVLDAELASRGMPRAFLRYEDLLRDWRTTLRQTMPQLQHQFPIDDPAAAGAVDQFLNPALRHNSVSVEQIIDNELVAPWIRETYGHLLDLCGGPEDPSILQKLDGVRSELERAARAFSSEVAGSEVAIERREAEARKLVQEVEVRLDQLRKQKASLEDELSEQKQRLATTQSNLSWQKQQLQAQRQRAAAALSRHRQTIRHLHATRWPTPMWDPARWRSGIKDSDAVRVPRYPPPIRLWGTRAGLAERLRMVKHAFALRNTSLFDAEWYLLRYSDIAHDGAHPLWHWLAIGWREGRQPNPMFEPKWYLDRYPDAAESGVNPLIHYLFTPPTDRRHPGPLFDPDWYLATYPDVRRANIDPLVHYLRHGMNEGRDPGPAFEQGWYLQQYPDVSHSGLPPIWHYVLTGRAEGRKTTPPEASNSSWAQRNHLEKLAPDSAEARELQLSGDQIAEARDTLQRMPIGGFSIIMPTWNRRESIAAAIDSVLAQSYADWELLICDDGSSDGTEGLVREQYADAIASGRIRYLSLQHRGVCAARNAGLKQAGKPWIAWLDSDNTWHEHYLLMTAAGYASHAGRLSAYACVHVHDNVAGHEYIRCLPFDWGRLLSRNYIDLNVFSHHRSLYEKLGGFDETLTRLVDWDLILRYTREHEPVFNRFVLCDYHLSNALGNISLRESLQKNEAAIRNKFAEALGRINEDRSTASSPREARGTTSQAAVNFRDFESFERKSLFLQTLHAPFSEEANRVIGHMHALRRHLSRNYSGMIDNAEGRVSVILSPAKHTTQGGWDEAVKSVLHQDYPNFELLIVTPGRADPGTLPPDSRIRRVQVDDSAPGDPRDAALGAAQGDYVVFIDSETRLVPDGLRILLGSLREAGDAAEIIIAAQALRSATTEGPDASPTAIRYCLFSRAVLENHNYLDLRGMMLRRELAERCGSLSPAEGGEWGFLLRATAASAPLNLPCLVCDVHADPDARQDSASAQGLPGADAIKASAQGGALATMLPPHRVPGLEAMHALPMPRTTPHSRPVSIVIPSYECEAHLRLCVDSVKAFTEGPYELIIVDNASSRGVRRYLSELSKSGQATVVLNARNYGFTYAVNQGIELAAADHDILLLNNDAVATPGWIGALQDVFERAPDAGMAVSRQVLLPGTRTMQTHNPLCDPERELDVNLSLHHNNVEEALPGSDGLIALRFAPFFCVYLPRDIVDLLGPLDYLNAPHYRSDRLYCEAVRRIANKRIVYTPHAKLYHFLQQATSHLRDRDRSAYDTLFVRNEWVNPEAEQPGQSTG